VKRKRGINSLKEKRERKRRDMMAAKFKLSCEVLVACREQHDMRGGTGRDKEEGQMGAPSGTGPALVPGALDDR
jgi:hypothetical protein